MTTHHKHSDPQTSRSLLSGITARSQYQLKRVWSAPPAALRGEVVDFWLAESAISSLAVAQDRAHHLLVVARASDGKVAGVSTAVRQRVEQLGFECFYYRTFIGQAHRTRGVCSTELIWEILQQSYRLLNECFQDGNDPKVLGLYAEMKNPSIMKCRNETVWQEDGMNFVYIGRTQDGRHKRVWYFDGARIL